MSTWKLGRGPYLEIGSLQMRLIKMRSYCFRVRSESNDAGPDEKSTGRHGHTGRRPRDEADIRVMGLQ